MTVIEIPGFGVSEELEDWECKFISSQRQKIDFWEEKWRSTSEGYELPLNSGIMEVGLGDTRGREKKDRGKKYVVEQMGTQKPLLLK